MSLHKEKSFEDELCAHLAAHGWLYSESDGGYVKDLALFPEDVFGWLSESQPEAWEKVVRRDDDPAVQAKAKARLLDRLVKTLDKPFEHGGGALNVLRRGFKEHPAQFAMCEFKPADSMNEAVLERYSRVRLRVMRQVHYSKHNANSIDLVFFVNGIPVATSEVKTTFTQSVGDAIEQYKTDRLPQSPGKGAEPLLSVGRRALVHFAVDNDEVWMTTRLAGAKTRFLPFNKGNDGHQGNPVNPHGSRTSYLWEETLSKDVWLTIIGKFMHLQVTESVNPVTEVKERRESLLFPRYHQYQAVTQLVETARSEGAGKKYLIQHSAGSGKTNSIAWLAHRLSSLHDAQDEKMFDSVVVITDRTVLDDQLQEAIFQIDHKQGMVVPIGDRIKTGTTGSFTSKSQALADALEKRAPIIIVTIQTFPFALQAMTGSNALQGRRFAIIADEAHSSQTGMAAATLKEVLSGEEYAELTDGGEASLEDVLAATMAHRANPTNISFFAFTATPKGKTLELFGRPGPDGKPAPFHLYSMQQAIEEKFILDVLRNYTSYKTAFRLAHNGQDYDSDEIVDQSQAMKSLMRWVKLHPETIGQKVQIIVEHFRTNVAHLLDGKAKAMVVTDSRKSAVRYKKAIDAYITKHGYKGLGTLVAFSGGVDDTESGPEEFTETNMNDLRGRTVADVFNKPEYRILLVANKYQTGFDQPLLTAMYVDKKLSGVTAVQTLSRLNRMATGKTNTYVIDFVNDPDEILKAFKPYFTAAALSDVTDPNIVHDLSDKLDQASVFTPDDVENTAQAWFVTKTQNALSAAIAPAKERFNDAYDEALSEGNTGEVERLELFRKDVTSFVNAYDFLSQIVDFEDADLEKRAIFLRLFAREIEDRNRKQGIDLSEVVMTHLANLDKGTQDLKLDGADGDNTLKPLTATGSGAARDPKMVRLAAVLEQLNTLFEGTGLSDDDALSVYEDMLRKMLDKEGLQEQAKSNTKVDFYDSPDLWPTIQTAVLDAGEFHTKGIAKLLDEDNKTQIIKTLVVGALYEMLRGDAEPATSRGIPHHGNAS